MRVLQPSERCKRACRYEYFHRLSNRLAAELNRCRENGEELPAHLQVYSTIDKVDDQIVKAMIAFETEGEWSSAKRCPALQEVFCRGLDGFDDEAAVRRCLTTRLAEPLADEAFSKARHPSGDPTLMAMFWLEAITAPSEPAPAVDSENEPFPDAPSWVVGVRWWPLGGRHREEILRTMVEWGYVMTPDVEWEKS